MSKNVYKDSPFGVAVHPHCFVPDTKFNVDGIFKVKVRYEGDIAARVKADIDAAAQQAFDDWMADDDGGGKLTPGERKKFSVYVPYTEEEDDNGDKTGSILVEYKQNAKIKLRDGTVKEIQIGIYDAAGKEMHKDFGSGSIIRVNYTMRPIPMKSLKQVGVRLDFGRVQVKDFKPKGQGGGGFGAVDGYEDDGEAEEAPQAGFGQVSGSADY